MAENREFQIVGRYLNGREVVGYHIQSLGSKKSMKISKEQAAYFIGKGIITNCTCQIYKGALLYRGKGMSLDDLPAEQTGDMIDNTDSEKNMTKLTVVGCLKSGSRTVGYVVQNAGCGTAKYSRRQVIDYASKGMITNVKVQMSNGKAILRGVGVNLDTLPSEEVEVTNTEE